MKDTLMNQPVIPNSESGLNQGNEGKADKRKQI
jgi:hypothetical protein